MVTSLNNSLKESEEVSLKRHYTATMAAISLGVTENGHENGLPEEEREEESVETSIDTILGKQIEVPPSSEDDSGSCLSTTPEAITPSMLSPEPEDATELEVEEKVENGDIVEGELTVTTTVMVSCSPRATPTLERKGEESEEKNTPTPAAAVAENEKGEGEKEGEKEKETNSSTTSSSSSSPEGSRARSCSSTQILVSNKDHTTLSVNLNNYDSDNTLSDEESHPELPTPPSEEDRKSDKSPSPPLGAITIKEDRTGSPNGEDGARLSPPTNGRRRSELCT